MKQFNPDLFNPNDLCKYMMRVVEENRDKINPQTGDPDKIIFCNEGGARAGKTFDTYHAIIAYCAMNPFPKHPSQPYLIYVVRKTLKSCREIAYQADFKKVLEILNLFDPKMATGEKSSPEYNLFGHTIKFRGLDNDEEFGRSDIVFVNEALDIDDETALNNLLLRCEKIAILDWNPKYTEHFLFKWQDRPNVYFTKTTFLNNKHVPKNVRSNILSTCPWDFKDFDFLTGKWACEERFRSPNQVNIDNKTANRWYWLVYGEGMRSPQEGAVFPNVEFIEEFPEYNSLERVVFGVDYGFTNDPSVLVKVGWTGKDVYIQYMFYEPTPTSRQLIPLIKKAFDEERQIRKKAAGGYKIEEPYAWGDSKDMNTNGDSMTAALRYAGHRVIKAVKMNIVPSIEIMKRYNLHVVISNGKAGKAAQNEFIGYVYEVVNGMVLNRPKGGKDHGIDAARYVFMMEGALRYNNKILNDD